jgi:hypothetical protein
MLQETWSEITGWGLILSGLSLAAWALSGRSEPRIAAADSMSRMLPIRAIEAPRRLERADEWRILMQIAERGFLCIEMLADMQERAREEVEAADEALSQLIAECARALMPADTEQAVGGKTPPPAASSVPVQPPLAA